MQTIVVLSEVNKSERNYLESFGERIFKNEKQFIEEYKKNAENNLCSEKIELSTLDWFTETMNNSDINIDDYWISFIYVQED